jgi:C1A family cysteine protease
METYQIPGPPSFNWHTKTPQCITKIKDQGFYCNNCWAFSAIAALEFHWCIKTNQTVTLSEQQLVDCNRNDQTGL